MVIEIRQVAKQGPAIWPQPSQEAARLAFLKQRLLLRRLDETPNLESHALIIREAEAAALLASRTRFPLLVFACLFEEKAAAALERQQRWWDKYWHGLIPATAGAARGRIAPSQRILQMNA